MAMAVLCAPRLKGGSAPILAALFHHLARCRDSCAITGTRYRCARPTWRRARQHRQLITGGSSALLRRVLAERSFKRRDLLVHLRKDSARVLRKVRLGEWAHEELA